MKKLGACVVAVLTALAAPGAGAGPATNLVFGSGADGAYPVAAVRGGAFARLSLTSDERGRPRLAYQFGAGGKEEAVPLRGLKLFSYADGADKGRVTVRGTKDASTEGDVVLDLGDGDGNSGAPGLLASTRLGSAGPSPAASGGELLAARSLVQALLAKRGIPRKAWPALLADLSVQPVRIMRGAAPVLVITGEGPVRAASAQANAAQANAAQADAEGERVFGYLLIAEAGAGRWTTAFQRTHFGGEVCGVTRWSYVDHADLDADGSDELLIEAWGWESFYPGTIIRRGPDGRWTATAAGDLPGGKGC